MVCLFGFGEINKKFLFLFLIPIFDISSRILIESIKENLYESNNISIDDEHTFVFLFTFINNISYIPAGLFHLIFYYKKKQLQL